MINKNLTRAEIKQAIANADVLLNRTPKRILKQNGISIEQLKAGRKMLVNRLHALNNAHGQPETKRDNMQA